VVIFRIRLGEGLRFKFGQFFKDSFEVLFSIVTLLDDSKAAV